MQENPNQPVILATVLFGLIFLTYLILKNNGEKGSLFNGAIFNNPINLFRLAKRTKNKRKKYMYFTLVFAIPILSIFFVISAYTRMSEFINRDECEYQKNFKNSEWNGKINDKYLDSANHSYPTISVKNDNEVFKIQAGILYDFNNFEHIQIGDSISKIKGELITHLYTSEGETELKSDFDCKK